MRIDSIARTAHIPNTVNHYPVILGRAIQVMGLPGHRDTGKGHTQGLTTVPTSSGTRDRRTYTPPNYCPTSSGTGADALHTAGCERREVKGVWERAHAKGMIMIVRV